MTAAQKRMRFIARIFAETGVRNLFHVVHALTLTHSRKQAIVRLRNEWVPVDPRQWVKRSDMQISVGLGAGDKSQQLAFLREIIQMQGMVAPKGLANEKTVYNALRRFTRAAGYKDEKEFWVDPSEQKPQPPQPPEAVMVEQMRGQVKLQVADRDGQIKMQQHQAELQVQAQNDARDAQREQDRAHMQAQLEQWKAQLAEQSKERDRTLDLTIAAMQEESARLAAAMPKHAPGASA
jgi:hypothetical protein